MEMTDREIAESYRRAKNRRGQITILSDLNQCDEYTICEVLDKQGEELPKGLKERLEKQHKRAMERLERERRREQTILRIPLDCFAKQGIPEPAMEAAKVRLRQVEELLAALEEERHELSEFIKSGMA
ncbi:MAG: hypothetical protein Q4C60_12195 [Eubacteriales bacterium]|nr:hypothetical protein [Eubacteriales bacterium]